MVSEKTTEQNNIGINAEAIIAKRYSQKDQDGNATEDWNAIATRVVNAVSFAEQPDTDSRTAFRQRALRLIKSRKFIPNTPCLVNAGKDNGQLAACFVLPVEDSIPGIMAHASYCAKVHQTGGGTGMTYQNLRPAGAHVGSSRGLASGPVSFMEIVNTATETIKQGGVRRGANMGIMCISHPDVLRFIHAKNNQTSLLNFNISVSVTDDFMTAVENRTWYQTTFNGVAWTQPVFDPLTGKDYEYQGAKPPKQGMIYAPEVWNRIVKSAHEYAEPGVIFIDEVNRQNHLMNSMGPIESCNPCGEQFLHSYNSCNLGSIDVAKFYNEEAGIIDWRGLREAVDVAVQFLDNVIDVCVWPLPEIEAVVKRTRPVGLGIMGFADLLLCLGIPYGSQHSMNVAQEIMGFVRKAAWERSMELGKQKGVFPEFSHNRDSYSTFFGSLELTGEYTPRNYEVTTIAPTGTISLVAETSSGIEPNFSWAYVRNDTVSKRVYAHPLAAKALGINLDTSDQASLERAAKEIVERESELPTYFTHAHTVTAESHVQMLAAFQQHVDNSISKTTNGSEDDTVENIDRLFKMAHTLSVKAISYYRDGSRVNQVMTSVTKKTETPAAVQPAPAEAQKARMKRPRELQGSTWQIPFDGTNVYVTITHDGVQAREVFLAGPISPAVGILASELLRTDGVTVQTVARKLSKVIGTHSVWFNERLCSSPEQAVAECLLLTQRRLDGEPESQRAAAHQNSGSKNGGPLCPDCASTVRRTEGCSVCDNCGWSKCS